MVLPVSSIVGVNVSVASGSILTPKATIITSNFNAIIKALFASNAIIKALFANSEKGFVFYPKNTSTLYQDTAGDIPIAALAQPIAKMQDLSGQEKHALQPNANLRPIILERGLQYPVNSPGFIVDVPVDLTDCTVIMSSQTSVFGIATGQTVSAGPINITPEGFCLVINRLLTAYEIVAIKEAINSFTTESLCWQLNSQRLMWNPLGTTLMWS